MGMNFGRKPVSFEKDERAVVPLHANVAELAKKITPHLSSPKNATKDLLFEEFPKTLDKIAKAYEETPAFLRAIVTTNIITPPPYQKDYFPVRKDFHSLLLPYQTP